MNTHVFTFKDSVGYKMRTIKSKRKSVNREEWNTLTRKLFGKNDTWVLVNYVMIID